jgi:hypothetical protein
MLKRHEVEIMLKAGHPQTEVARLAGVSLCFQLERVHPATFRRMSYSLLNSLFFR